MGCAAARERKRERESLGGDKHFVVSVCRQWDMFMFTVGMEVMDEARREVGEGEGKYFFPSFCLFFLFFFASSSSFPISLNMKRPAKGRVRIQSELSKNGGMDVFT